MSTIDAAAITALSRRITDTAGEVGTYARGLGLLLPPDQWQSPAAGRFQLELQAAAGALARVSSLLSDAVLLLLAHLHEAQRREQEIAATAAKTVHTAEHVLANASGAVLAAFGIGSAPA